MLKKQYQECVKTPRNVSLRWLVSVLQSEHSIRNFNLTKESAHSFHLCPCSHHLRGNPADNCRVWRCWSRQICYDFQEEVIFLSRDPCLTLHLFTILPQAKHINGGRGSIIKCQLEVFCLTSHWKLCDLIFYSVSQYCLSCFISSTLPCFHAQFLGLLIKSYYCPSEIQTSIYSTRPALQLCYYPLYCPTFRRSYWKGIVSHQVPLHSLQNLSAPTASILFH